MFYHAGVNEKLIFFLEIQHSFTLFPFYHDEIMITQLNVFKKIYILEKHKEFLMLFGETLRIDAKLRLKIA